MSIRWTHDELTAYRQKRTTLNEVDKTDASESEDSESRLQRRIIEYCESNGYYVFHDYSRAVNKPGHPDLIIAMPEGRIVWIELKSKTGRMTDDQTRVYLQLKAMRHEAYRNVRSFKQFIAIIQGGK